LDLTLYQSQGPVLLKDIARRQRIPLSYLEHLTTPLVAGDILVSTRGAKGGVSLAKPPEQVTLSEVVQLLEGSVAPAECVNNPALCDRSNKCATRDVWGQVEKAMNEVLESTSLRDLAERQTKMETSEPIMYYI
jgi:Rrf2 family protein